MLGTSCLSGCLSLLGSRAGVDAAIVETVVAIENVTVSLTEVTAGALTE